MKVGGREYVLVPKFLFEGAHPACNKFLLSVFDDGTSDLDGCHSDAQGVAEAKHLIERLGLGDRPRKCWMLTVEEVPVFRGKVNEEAIAVLAPAVRKYKNRKKGIA